MAVSAPRVGSDGMLRPSGTRTSGCTGLSGGKTQEPPTPSYGDAQRTRITVGVTPAAGSKNAITALAIKRGAQVVKPATQSFDGGGGRFIFDFPAFAPTAAITIEMTGKTRTISCVVDQAILAKFR